MQRLPESSQQTDSHQTDCLGPQNTGHKAYTGVCPGSAGRLFTYTQGWVGRGVWCLGKPPPISTGETPAQAGRGVTAQRTAREARPPSENAS